MKAWKGESERTVGRIGVISGGAEMAKSSTIEFSWQGRKLSPSVFSYLSLLVVNDLSLSIFSGLRRSPVPSESRDGVNKVDFGWGRKYNKSMKS